MDDLGEVARDEFGRNADVRFPPNWPHAIRYVSSDGQDLLEPTSPGVRRVVIPEFEEWCEEATQAAALKNVRAKVLKKLAGLCQHLDMESGTVIVPIRTEYVLVSGKQPNFVGIVQLGMMFTQGDCESSPYDRPASWIPRQICDPEFFAEHFEEICLVSDVMED